MKSAAVVLPRFTHADAERANEAWGANCGPAALALVAGLSLDEVRPYLGDFQQKGYTNPTLMFESLARLGCLFRIRSKAENCPALSWPAFGLARVQWEGPWSNPGVPLRARYRYTHWVAAQRIGDDQGIFDVNCLNNGSGWVSLCEWSEVLVLWLLKECYPRANGRWHLTHSVEVEIPR